MTTYDVIVEKVINIDQNSRIVKPMVKPLLRLFGQLPNCRPNPSLNTADADATQHDS